MPKRIQIFNESLQDLNREAEEIEQWMRENLDQLNSEFEDLYPRLREYDWKIGNELKEFNRELNNKLAPENVNLERANSVTVKKRRPWLAFLITGTIVLILFSPAWGPALGNAYRNNFYDISKFESAEYPKAYYSTKLTGIKISNVTYSKYTNGVLIVFDEPDYYSLLRIFEKFEIRAFSETERIEISTQMSNKSSTGMNFISVAPENDAEKIVWIELAPYKDDLTDEYLRFKIE